METEIVDIAFAKFIGLQTGKQLGYERWLNDWFDNECAINGQRNTHLQFSSDWNWIMAVVEKIETLDMFVLHSSFFNKRSISIKAEYNRTFKIIEIHYENPKDKLIKTYQACWEFLEWYNRQ